MRRVRMGVAAVLFVVAVGGCGAAAAPSGEPDAGSDARPSLSIAELQDPATCEPCHVEHVRQWESSMHAYAARDPVFVAMNERGQLETDGGLGDFCVQCHAPMALELGLTSDGLNLPDVDDPNARGVTCYFCHDVSEVEDDHNRGLTLAHDGVMRGGLGHRAEREGAEPSNSEAPLANGAHASRYSPLHDGTQVEAAGLCGACHDVVNDHGVELERTFAEWRSSRFAEPGDDQRTCAACHMPGRAASAAPDGPVRRVHAHLWPGVDVALEPAFPGIDAQRAAIGCMFEGALELELSVTGALDAPQAEVALRNLNVGHAWPSGAAQDRRAWIELVAFDDAGTTVLESGVVADGEVVGADDPELRVLRDRLYDERGDRVHMFWEAAPSAAHPAGYASDLLSPERAGRPSPQTFGYALPKTTARVTARLRVQAIGLDVLDDFRGLTLPIAERVLRNGYVQGNTLRSRVRTLTVPGTERELRRSGDGFEAVAVDAAPSACEMP